MRGRERDSEREIDSERKILRETARDSERQRETARSRKRERERERERVHVAYMKTSHTPVSCMSESCVRVCTLDIDYTRMRSRSRRRSDLKL